MNTYLKYLNSWHIDYIDYNTIMTCSILVNPTNRDASIVMADACAIHNTYVINNLLTARICVDARLNVWSISHA